MPTPIYVNLTYHQYKKFEEQFKRGIGPLESSHTSMDERYYHKAVRFTLGDLEFEVTGPAVQAPRRVCPLCDQPSLDGEAHQECADRETARSEQGDRHQ